MFEPGKTYSFVTTDHDGESHWSAKLIDVEGPLLKVARMDGEMIFNSHSPSFVSACVWSEDKERERAEQRIEWGKLLADSAIVDDSKSSE